ncbi:MAG: peptidoglycan-binding protein LysM [Proteobacteria bacterium]|nr:peptidoglycan-binding protein LysM [Pseudomonadota bacterium]
MGLFSFVKSVGNKIFGASEAQAAPAEELAKEVGKHGLDVSGLDIKVNGNKITVGGSTKDTAEAEKIILALGNTLGVSEVESNLTIVKEYPPAVMYEVKKGDTLWKIAETHYGKGKGAQYEGIFEANKPMLSHPDKIYPGQILRIPPLA